MKYSFRSCRLEDFDFLFNLKKENFKWYVDKIWGWKDDEQKERLQQDLEEHLSHKRIILVDDKPVGVYVVHTTKDGDLFINEISILEEYKNKGLGRKILEEQLKENHKKGIRTILQVFKDNPAKTLYEKLGFRIYGETETHYQMENVSNGDIMRYKLIAMDFDGTLLTSDKKITEKNRSVLQKYRNNKYIIVGITARNLSSVNNVCDINIFNYLILNNGSYIYDVEKDIGIDIGHIDKNTLIKITNNFKDFAEEIDYCSLNKYYIYKKENVDNKGFIVKIKSIEDIKEVIVRMNIFLSSNEEISKCRKYIESEFEDLNVFEMLDTDNNSFKKWIALNPKGIDKFKALEVLCNKIGINLEEVIFFGDSANDLSIINKVGLGVAMGNALTEVKKQAKEITLSNDEDGIANFLEKTILLD